MMDAVALCRAPRAQHGHVYDARDVRGVLGDELYGLLPLRVLLSRLWGCQFRRMETTVIKIG
jgi:hypothetical protein